MCHHEISWGWGWWHLKIYTFPPSSAIGSTYHLPYWKVSVDDYTNHPEILNWIWYGIHTYRKKRIHETNNWKFWGYSYASIGKSSFHIEIFGFHSFHFTEEQRFYQLPFLVTGTNLFATRPATKMCWCFQRGSSWLRLGTQVESEIDGNRGTLASPRPNKEWSIVQGSLNYPFWGNQRIQIYGPFLSCMKLGLVSYNDPCLTV